MEKKHDDIKRNRPVEEGRDNDPNIRDYSAQQPGVQTMSDIGTDEDFNNRLTKTSSGNSTEEEFGADADPSFDEIGENADDDQ